LSSSRRCKKGFRQPSGIFEDLKKVEEVALLLVWCAAVVDVVVV
jgi:hypothetical protein